MFAVILMLAGAFIVGMFWNRLQSLEAELAELKSAGNKVQQADTGGQQQARQPAQQAPQVSLDDIRALFNEDNLYVGDPSSDNLLVEFSDPSCPYCHAAAGQNPSLNSQMGPNFVMVEDGGTYVAPVPEMKKLVEQGEAAFVWLYTPGHGAGEMATKAIYCAHEQGKFWEVHDKLMTSEAYDVINEEVKNDKNKSQQLVDFIGTAANSSELKTCLDSGRYDAKLSQDTATARKLGISGTPGFYVNETVYKGAYSWTDMEGSLN